jgi:hypothetical protein
MFLKTTITSLFTAIILIPIPAQTHEVLEKSVFKSQSIVDTRCFFGELNFHKAGSCKKLVITEYSKGRISFEFVENAENSMIFVTERDLKKGDVLEWYKIIFYTFKSKGEASEVYNNINLEESGCYIDRRKSKVNCRSVEVDGRFVYLGTIDY